MLLAVLIDQRIGPKNLFRNHFSLSDGAVLCRDGNGMWGGFSTQQSALSIRPGLAGMEFRSMWIVDRNMRSTRFSDRGPLAGFRFAMALFLAGLRSLDADLYNAAHD